MTNTRPHVLLRTGPCGYGMIALLLPHRPALHSAQIPNKGTNASLFGRAERSSPTAAQRCAEGAGLDGGGADRTTIKRA